MTPVRPALPRGIEQFIGALVIEPGYYSAMLARLQVEGAEALKADLAAAFEVEAAPLSTRLGDVAVLDISGPLTKHDDPWAVFFGGTSATSIKRELAMLAKDPAVKSVVARIDSPGGTVSGTFDAGQAIFDFPKPVVTFVEDMAASGGLHLATQGDEVLLTKTSLMGSLGVIWGGFDLSKLYADMGVKPVVITADGGSGIKGTFFPGTEVTAAQREHIQAIVDDTRLAFIADVARGRALSQEQVTKMADARMHVGQKAVDLGFADRVGTFEDAIATAIQAGKGNRRRRRSSYGAASGESTTASTDGTTNRTPTLVSVRRALVKAQPADDVEPFLAHLPDPVEAALWRDYVAGRIGIEDVAFELDLALEDLQ